MLWFQASQKNTDDKDIWAKRTIEYQNAFNIKKDRTVHGDNIPQQWKSKDEMTCCTVGYGPLPC